MSTTSSLSIHEFEVYVPVILCTIVAATIIAYAIPKIEIPVSTRAGALFAFFLVYQLMYIAVVLSLVFTWSKTYLSLMNSISTMHSDIDRLIHKIDLDCACFPLAGSAVAMVQHSGIYHLLVMCDQLMRSLHPIFIIVLVAGFMILVVCNIIMTMVRPNLGARSILFGLVLMALITSVFMVMMVIPDIFIHARNSAENSVHIAEQILAGDFSCIAFKSDQGDTSLTATDCLYPDYTNTTSCVYTVPYMFATLEQSSGYPGLTAQTRINVSAPFNSSTAYSSPSFDACEEACMAGNSTVPNLNDQVCATQASVNRVLNYDIDKYKAQTFAITYGLIYITIVYLFLGWIVSSLATETSTMTTGSYFTVDNESFLQ